MRQALADQRSFLARTGAVFPMKKSTMWAQKGDSPFYGATYHHRRYYAGQPPLNGRRNHP